MTSRDWGLTLLGFLLANTITFVWKEWGTKNRRL